MAASDTDLISLSRHARQRPGIHVFLTSLKKVVDGRVKPGHDVDGDALSILEIVRRISGQALR